MNNFPKNFLWGVATSAYQIEGGNSNADWWEWEKSGKAKDQSGRACDYWNRWPSDHALLSELGVKAFRLSIEWSRVETEKGVFSSEAIQKYREILQDLRNRNIKTQVTLWWWVSPLWFQEKYGFHKKASVAIFARYAQKITEELGDLIDIFTIFNEPMVPLGQGFLGGVFPPGFKNPWKFTCAVNNISRAYKESYKIIHKIKPGAPVGITYLYNWYESEGLGPLLRLVNKLSQWFRIDLLGDKIKGFQDYIGVDYYRLGKIKFDWKNIRLDSKNQTYFGFTIEEDKDNVMKWTTYPEGMYKVLKEASDKFKLPIYITENGGPTRAGLADEDRIKFIREHLFFVRKAIEDGLDIRGYNVWSLFDNLEWLYGYAPRFGLIEIDYRTLERKPRKSFYAYKEIIKNAVIASETKQSN
ncbi:MAG: family 1 glycosylhydrolase [Candidatus Moraniibacteriota bacterium]